MQTKIVRHRKSAYNAQAGHCYYCGSHMWEKNPKTFAQAHNINATQALQLKCTAEHLVARKDGGGNSAQNIVAACLFCNQTRHRRKKPLDPDSYRMLVQKRLFNGHWLYKSLST